MELNLDEDDEREFAYGANEVDGCYCPIAAAFPDEAKGESSFHNIEYGTAAGAYDVVVREKMYAMSGHTATVDEETARKAWLRARDNFDAPSIVAVFDDVAEELGWD